MDGRPIGVFDSGLGGLTAVKELVSILPGENIVYLGDTGRVPYGPRSAETISKYTAQAVEFLKKKDVKHIIIACGTSSSVALENAGLFREGRITGVIGPAAEKAAAVTVSGRIGVIGTAATVRSGAFERRIAALRPSAETFSVPCPLLVPLVEAGRLSESDIVIKTVLAEYLAPLKEKAVDTLVMGCTHYPLLRGLISREMGEGVALVDAGAEAARQVKAELEREGRLSAGEGRIRYHVTDSVGGFAAVAELFLQTSVRGSVEKAELGD